MLKAIEDGITYLNQYSKDHYTNVQAFYDHCIDVLKYKLESDLTIIKVISTMWDDIKTLLANVSKEKIYNINELIKMFMEECNISIASKGDKQDESCLLYRNYTFLYKNVSNWVFVPAAFKSKPMMECGMIYHNVLVNEGKTNMLGVRLIQPNYSELNKAAVKNFVNSVLKAKKSDFMPIGIIKNAVDAFGYFLLRNRPLNSIYMLSIQNGEFGKKTMYLVFPNNEVLELNGDNLFILLKMEVVGGKFSEDSRPDKKSMTLPNIRIVDDKFYMNNMLSHKLTQETITRNKIRAFIYIFGQKQIKYIPNGKRDIDRFKALCSFMFYGQIKEEKKDLWARWTPFFTSKASIKSGQDYVSGLVPNIRTKQIYNKFEESFLIPTDMVDVKGHDIPLLPDENIFEETAELVFGGSGLRKIKIKKDIPHVTRYLIWKTFDVIFNEIDTWNKNWGGIGMAMLMYNHEIFEVIHGAAMRLVGPKWDNIKKISMIVPYIHTLIRIISLNKNYIIPERHDFLGDDYDPNASDYSVVLGYVPLRASLAGGGCLENIELLEKKRISFF